MAKAAIKAKPASAPPPSTVEIFDEFDQGSDEWINLRLGTMTASNFGVIMRNGRDGGESKTRTELLYKLAGEILTGTPAEHYKSAAMQRGNDMEDDARQFYARNNFASIRRIGFAKRKLPNGIIVGCSPDALVDDDGALEIKTMAPHLLIEQMVRGGGPPPAFRAQLHGNLWVLERRWIDLQLFYRGMPTAPKFKVGRDDVFIREISEAVEVFDYELRKLVEKIKSMGVR